MDWANRMIMPGRSTSGPPSVSPPMLLVLCRDPLEPARPDRAFEAEVAAIERLGLPYVLVDHDALVRGDDPGRAVRRDAEQPEPVLAAYRGWMVTPIQYRGLYESLAAKGVR